MPAITQRHIEVFRAVMSSGGVTAAAQALHSSQPTISRDLARIEQLLGYALFTRHRGRLIPSARAQTLFDEIQRAYVGLDHLQRFAERLKTSTTGPINVTCQPAYSASLLPGACARLSLDLPDAQVLITPQESPWLEESLSAQRFDIGVTESARPVAGAALSPLFKADEVCVLPVRHPLATKPLLTPHDFAGEAFVSLSGGDPYRRQIDAIFSECGVERQLRIETHSADAVCAMVAKGLGLAIVNPLTALMQLPRKLSLDHGLVVRPFSVSIPYEISLVRPLYRAANTQADALAGVIQAEAQALAKELDGLLCSGHGTCIDG
jgi:DNA-binding transcriptional LysR family regulator